MAEQSIKSNGNIYWDWDNGKEGMIDIRDVVDCAWGALTGKVKKGQGNILSGPASISMYDVANTFTKVFEKEVNYVPVPHEASKEAMMGMGFPEFIVEGFIELNVGFTNGYADISNRNAVKFILNR